MKSLKLYKVIGGILVEKLNKCLFEAEQLVDPLVKDRNLLVEINDILYFLSSHSRD